MFANTGAVSLLLKKGAHVNDQDLLRRTALDCAQTEPMKKVLRAQGDKTGIELREKQ